jgi:CRISPR system Cascade subunit CasC
VSCLNRDDGGVPKTATIGGVTRARVSSQAWKRPIRLAMRAQGTIPLGTRTKFVSALVQEACKGLGATDEQAKHCGDWLQEAFVKSQEPKTRKTGKEGKEGKIDEETDRPAEKDATSDALIFLSPKEIAQLSIMKAAAASRRARTEATSAGGATTLTCSPWRSTFALRAVGRRVVDLHLAGLAPRAEA